MLKRKNDRQPPQRLKEERYPNDYWLDEEDGGEDIPDPAVSSKPDITRDKIVALMGDIPRIELFARQETAGWDTWGNETKNSIEL